MYGSRMVTWSGDDVQRAHPSLLALDQVLLCSSCEQLLRAFSKFVFAFGIDFGLPRPEPRFGLSWLTLPSLAKMRSPLYCLLTVRSPDAIAEDAWCPSSHGLAPFVGLATRAPSGGEYTRRPQRRLVVRTHDESAPRADESVEPPSAASRNASTVRAEARPKRRPSRLRRSGAQCRCRVQSSLRPRSPPASGGHAANRRRRSASVARPSRVCRSSQQMSEESSSSCGSLRSRGHGRSTFGPSPRCVCRPVDAARSRSASPSAARRRSRSRRLACRSWSGSRPPFSSARACSCAELSAHRVRDASPSCRSAASEGRPLVKRSADKRDGSVARSCLGARRRYFSCCCVKTCASPSCTCRPSRDDILRP